MNEDDRHGQPPPAPAPGWAGLLVQALAEAYLVFIAALAVIVFVPSIFLWHATVVQTGSMEPHISPGDVVLLAPWAGTDPVPLGGVVQFRSEAAAEPDGVARLRLHRIVAERHDGTFTTAGDANQDVDSTALDRNQITGQARLLVPLVGLPGFWAGTGNFMALLGWAAVTGASLFVVLRGAARKTAPSGTVGAGRGNPTGQASDGAGRRAALALAGVAGAGILLGQRAPRSFAAFTALTSTKGIWSVAERPVLSLGRAASYVLLAHTRIQHSPVLGIGTDIKGNVATSPGTAVDGFWPWDITGSIDRNTAGARNAKSDVLALYADLSKYPAATMRSPTLSGTILPGVYASTTGRFTVNGALTLDAHGDPSARFIFHAEAITTADKSNIVLAGKASANNVYWRSAGEIDLGTSSTARGVFLANGSARVESGATLSGRLYSCTGTITVTRATIGVP